MYKCYTDGAASKNGYDGAIAGWAFVIYDEEDKIIYEDAGRIDGGTNNIGELTAILRAMQYINQNLRAHPVSIFTDSAYCFNGITSWMNNWKNNGWTRGAQKEKLKNKEIWIGIDENYDPVLMTLSKVKGHADDEKNNYVDKKAVAQTK